MNRTYLGAICGAEGSYGIVFRDLPGCVSAGDTLDNVRQGAAEALSLHLETMLDYGDVIPDPTEHSLGDVIEWLRDPDDPDDNGPWVKLVQISVCVPTPRETFTVRLKADLVQRIAELNPVASLQMSSGRFIEQAVEHEIERYRKSAA